MPRLLITAFAPYAEWPFNASHETLRAWLQEDTAGTSGHRDSGLQIETATLPVHYEQAQQGLAKLRGRGFDFTLLLGQSPGSEVPALEMFALNIKADRDHQPQPLDPQGPQALKSELPLEQWKSALEQAGVRSQVSFHAGAYLCNAVYYWSLRHDTERGSADRSLFLHLPLIAEGVTSDPLTTAAPRKAPLARNVAALDLVVRQIERRLRTDYAGAETA